MPSDYHFTLTARPHAHSPVHIEVQGKADNGSVVPHILEAATDAFLRAINSLPSPPPDTEPAHAEPQ